jgi:hypothetical protein
MYRLVARGKKNLTIEEKMKLMGLLADERNWY